MVTTLTPELAQEWLSIPKPWPVCPTFPSPNRVAEYADVMSQGQWRDGGQMTLDRYGIVDGNHRAAAVVSSGVSIIVNVRFK